MAGNELARSSGNLGLDLGWEEEGEKGGTFVAAGSEVPSHADPGVLVFQPGLMVLFLVSLASCLHSFQK